MTFPSFIPQDQYPGTQNPTLPIPLAQYAQPTDDQHPSLEGQTTPPAKPQRSSGHFIHNMLLIGILVGGGIFGYHALNDIASIVDLLGSNVYEHVSPTNSTVA